MSDFNIILFFSNPLYIFFSLISVIILFHVFFILLIGLKDVGWKIVDYFWLSFAALTIFSMTYQIRLEWYAIDIENSRLMKENSLNNLKNKARHSVSDICVEERISIRDKDYDLACMYFKKITKEVIDSESIRNVAFIDFIDDGEIEKIRLSLRKEELLKEFDGLLKAHEDFLVSIDKYNKYELFVRRTEMEKILIYIFPLFFIIALSLRITKVTGEILLKTNPNIIGIWGRRLNMIEKK